MRFILLFATILGISLPAVAQNRDSILYDYFKQGLISQDKYFESVSTAKKQTQISDNIMRLKSELRYKFVLDFVVNYLGAEPPGFDTTAMQDPSLNVLVRKPGPQVIQAFIYAGTAYSLYNVNSFNGHQDYYLLTASSPSDIGELYLLANDTSRWSLLDTFALPAHQGKCMLQNVNGYHVIKVEQSPWGTGFSSTDEAFLGIINDKFKTLFGVKKIEVISLPNGTAKQTVRSVKFVPAGVGNVPEIAEDDTVSIINTDVTIGDEGPIYHTRVLKLLSVSKKSFEWNEYTDSYTPK